MRTIVNLFAVMFALGGNLLAYDNSPSDQLIFPEVIWAQATGGGTWMSELQVTNFTTGNTLTARFFYGGGSYRVVTFTNKPEQYSSVKFPNILAAMQSLDPTFTYYGRVGALRLDTQDVDHFIHGAVRTYNGNYSKTFQGLKFTAASNTANDVRWMIIQNLVNNATYRCSAGFFATGSIDLIFYIYGADGSILGGFQKVFVPNDFKSFNPFSEAGIPYPAQSHDNCILLTFTIAGSGSLFCFGATANNFSNDPAAHIAVQYGN